MVTPVIVTASLRSSSRRSLVCSWRSPLPRADHRRSEQPPPQARAGRKAVDPATAGIDHRPGRLHRQSAGARSHQDGERSLVRDRRRSEAARRRRARRGRRRAQERLRARQGRPGSGLHVRRRPSTPVVLDQKGCLYMPRVMGVRVGQPLETGEHRSDVPQRARAAEREPRVQPRPRTRLPADAAHVHQRRKSWSASSATCTAGWRPTSASSPHPFFAVTAADGTFSSDGRAARHLHGRSVARECSAHARRRSRSATGRHGAAVVLVRRRLDRGSAVIWLHRYARLLVAATLLLVAAGGMVTSTSSGPRRCPTGRRPTATRCSRSRSAAWSAASSTSMAIG